MLLYIDTSAVSTLYIIPIIVCIIGVLADFGLAVIPAVIASKKGLSSVGFYFFGLGCLPAAIIVACVLKGKSTASSSAPGQQNYQQ